ncbi:cytochrome P450 [Schizophyllum amplum]|uniref:Cytochrome P450 n=1 Tax=Schizophyllum amplum TaxID=97359 RepID=A0A550CM72_9AGAR|nr:cytochrome P450 [Auriculariopsis ampla]
MPNSELTWVTFEAWTRQYGSLFTLNLGAGEHLIVVGTYKAATELLERQAPSFADRPRSIAAGELLSGGMRTLFIPKGERIRKSRKALLMSLQPSASAVHKPVQLKAARIALLDILRKPEAFVDHFRKYAASIIMHITYGKCAPTRPSDPDVLAVNACLARLAKSLMPGAWLVDSVPLLRYVPGYTKELNKWHASELELFRGKLREVQEKMAAGHVRPCFATQVLQAQDALGLSFDECAYLCGSQFGAGSDTTASYLTIATMAAALYPEAQKRAQSELDAVVGKGRPPSFDDHDSLPYVTAFVQEVDRWRPISAGGIQHRATEDVIYDGYIIPKSSRIVGSHWSIHHDPAVFAEPNVFMPERWLAEDACEDADDSKKRLRLRTDIRNFTFGFGRRACPGSHVATRSAWINIAHYLWALDVREDPERPIDSMGFEHIANTRPKPFFPIIRPRAGLTVEGIRDTLLCEDPTLEEGWLTI